MNEQIEKTVAQTNPKNDSKNQIDFNALAEEVASLKAKILSIEAYFVNAVTDNTHFVCNDNATYNGTNSKIITVTKGIITNIES